MSFFVRKRGGGRSSLPQKLTDRASGPPSRKQSGGPRRGAGPSRPLQRKRGPAAGARPPPTKQSKHDEDEITSESEDEETEDAAAVDSNADDDSESETEQEARVRIAKEQIKQLKQQLLEKQVDADDERIGALLKDQELVEEGKVLRKIVTDAFREKQLQVDVVVRGKIIKSPLTCTRVSSNRVYASTKSGLVLCYDLTSKTRVHVTLPPPPITSLAASPSHVAASTSMSIHLLDPITLQKTHTFKSARNATHLSISPTTLFSTHKDRTIKLWNLTERAYVESLFGHQDVPTAVDVVSCNRIVSAGGFDKTMRVWKIDEESHLVYNWPEDIIDVVRVLSGGFFIAGSCSGNLALFSFGRKKPLHVINHAHGVNPHDVPRWITAVGGTGDFVASGSDDGLVRIWRVVQRKFEFVRTVDVPDGVVIGIDVVAEGEDDVKVVVGISTEMRTGRWSPKVKGNNCSKIVVVL